MKSKTRFQDILALNVWVNIVSKVNWTALILSGLLVSLGIALLSLRRESLFMDAWLLIAGFGIGCTLVVLLSIPIFMLALIYNYFHKGSLGNKEFLLSDIGITENDGYRETKVSWKKVRKIYITHNHIFIRISILKYMILARRDFESDYKFAQYYSELLRLKENCIY